MQTAGSEPDLMSTAVIARLPVTASGRLGNHGLHKRAFHGAPQHHRRFDPAEGLGAD